MEKKPNTYVTQPFLPPLEEFIPYLEEIWENKWLTNAGPFHEKLELELAKHLGVPYISLFANGTIALVTALQALRITGEVITTPYSFVATAHSLLWNGLNPVFVDIDKDSFNIDSSKIEQAISQHTTAIMPVHCYGNPCQVEKIQDIADTYGLKVIYDSAHAFDVRFKNKSVLEFGDLSILSFHATKLYNTFEGGAIVSHDKKTKTRIDYLKNFGIADEVTVMAPGINGKMNEVQAAFGLLQLKYVRDCTNKRKIIDELYRSLLHDSPGISCPKLQSHTIHNYSYFPILVDEKCGISRDELYEKLKSNNIYSRRYFYPLISNLPMYRGFKSSIYENLIVANNASRDVLCLPLYPSLDHEEVERIASIITRLASP